MTQRRPTRGPERKPSPKEQRRAKRRLRRRIQRYLIIGGVGFIGLLIVLSLVIPSIGGGGAEQPAIPSGPGTQVAIVGANHISQVDQAPAGAYNSSPPTSGVHWALWADCGFYSSAGAKDVYAKYLPKEEPQAFIPDELQVHNLEHGFVLVQYNTEDQAIIDQLKAVVEVIPGYPNHLIVASYPKMEKPIALTAWGAIQYLDNVDEASIQAFIGAYRDRGPERNQPGCYPKEEKRAEEKEQATPQPAPR